ncbi:SET domain-containing protein [Vibrio cholerae]
MSDVTKNIDFVRQVTLDTISDTTIGLSPIHGFGLFLTKSKLANTIIGKLDGQFMSESDYNYINSLISPEVDRYKNYFFMECTYLEDNMVLVRSLRTKYSYINHSRSPNIKIDFNSMELVTLCDLDSGTELLIDYRKEWLPETYTRSEKGKYL